MLIDLPQRESSVLCRFPVLSNEILIIRHNHETRAELHRCWTVPQLV